MHFLSSVFETANRLNKEDWCEFKIEASQISCNINKLSLEAECFCKILSFEKAISRAGVSALIESNRRFDAFLPKGQFRFTYPTPPPSNRSVSTILSTWTKSKGANDISRSNWSPSFFPLGEHGVDLKGLSHLYPKDSESCSSTCLIVSFSDRRSQNEDEVLISEAYFRRQYFLHSLSEI